MQPIVAKREIVCKSDRLSLWRALGQTDRFNRELGNATIRLTEVADDGAARYVVKQRLAGMELEYEELPFRWREPDLIHISRIFHNGPVLRYELRWELEERDDGTTGIAQSLLLTPRALLYNPFVRLNARRFSTKMERLIGRIDARLQAGQQPYDTEARFAANPSALEHAARALLGVVRQANREIAENLVAHVASADDLEVGRMRPYELAERWGVGGVRQRRRVLEVCLGAVEVGLLELSWDIICPSCRTTSAQLPSVSELGETGHCHVCDLSISIDFDRAVEATFRPAGAVRSVGEQVYCISGPFRTPHVVAQTVIPGKGAIELEAPAEPGRYRLFIRGGRVVSLEVGDDGEASVSLAAESADGMVQLRRGASIELTQAGSSDRHAKIERLEWISKAATAFDVSTLRRFRERFSAEVLTPGVMLKVRRVAFLFTDLIGHTGLYATLGDAGAYRFVQDHFEVLFDVVDEHDGAVIKTIGDAIMAAFTAEADAVRAAIAIQRAYQQFAAGQEHADKVGLRVGAYAGSCYAVTTNNLLDYFGTTVILAQRLEGLANAGEIILAAELATRAELLEGAEVLEQLDAAPKGLDVEVPVLRLRAI